MLRFTSCINLDALNITAGQLWIFCTHLFSHLFFHYIISHWGYSDSVCFSGILNTKFRSYYSHNFITQKKLT